jgi:glutaredoxin
VNFAYGLFFGHNMMLSSDSSASNPRVAVYDNNVYAVWTDNSSKGNSDIIFRKSTDKGATFDTAKNLSNNPGNSTNPLITAHRNNVYVVWTDDTAGNADINFRKSSDYGNNFNRTINLSRNNGSSISPQLAATGNNVYVVWTDDTRGNTDISLKVSHDYGNNFGRTKPVSRNNGSSIFPQLAATGNNVYVVWTDDTKGNNNIDSKVSHDYGNNFGRTKPVSRNNGSSVYPQLAANGNNVYVVWTDDTSGNTDINFRKSSDYGNNFNSTINLSRNNGSSVYPQLAANGNNVYVVWTDDTSGNTDINFRKSSDYGNKFVGEKNLSEKLGSSFYDPKIAALDREKIHITLTAGMNNETEIFFTASGDSGEHFDNALNLSRSTLVSESVYMTAYQKDLYLVWVEADNSRMGGEIFFKRLSEVSFPRNAKSNDIAN